MSRLFLNGVSTPESSRKVRISSGDFLCNDCRGTLGDLWPSCIAPEQSYEKGLISRFSMNVLTKPLTPNAISSRKCFADFQRPGIQFVIMEASGFNRALPPSFWYDYVEGITPYLIFHKSFNISPGFSLLLFKTVSKGLFDLNIKPVFILRRLFCNKPLS